MTTREKLKSLLVNNGMFDTQAEEVLKIAIPEIEKITPNYRITWNHPAEEYPKEIYACWWFTLRPIALKWIEDNLPQAWFKSMFE